MADPYGATFSEFLNDPDRRSAARARQGEGESMHERAARQHAEIVGLAEAIAPDVAREENISVDQAREKLTSGVRYPEPALTQFYHQTLGRLLGSPPQGGEPSLARVERLKGRAMASDIAAGRRKEALGEVGTLEKLAGQMRDPKAMSGPITERLHAAGIDLPEGTLSGLRGSVPRSDFEAYSDPETRQQYEDFSRFEAGLRPRAQPAERDVQFRSLVSAYEAQGMKPADAIIAATHDLHGGRGRARKSRAEYELERLKNDPRSMMSGDAHDSWVSEWNAALSQVEGEQGGRGRPSLRDIGPTGATPEPSVENPDDFIDRALGGPGLGQEYLR